MEFDITTLPVKSKTSIFLILSVELNMNSWSENGFGYILKIEFSFEPKEIIFPDTSIPFNEM